MIRKLLAAVLLGGFVVGCAGPTQSLAVTETSITAIYKNPKAFDGRLVRVRGVLDQCGRFSCGLCESPPGFLPGDRAQCLRPVFDDLLGGAHLDSLYRFSEITIEGRYDFSCDAFDQAAKELNRKDRNSGIQEIIVCTDRASNLHVTKVVQVHKRWPATQGLYHDYLGGPLASAPSDLVQQIVQQHDLFLPEGSTLKLRTKRIGKDYMVLKRTSLDLPDNPGAFLCICNNTDCTGQWPTHDGHVWLASVVEPYRCSLAEEVHGAWRFPPQFE